MALTFGEAADASTPGKVMGFLPFVKKATLSASADLPAGKLWYLDGFNNPGFSGGPVAFAVSEANDLHLMAVVSGYRPDWQRLYLGGRATEAAEVATNSGIIFAFDIGPVATLIAEDVAGSGG